MTASLSDSAVESSEGHVVDDVRFTGDFQRVIQLVCELGRNHADRLTRVNVNEDPLRPWRWHELKASPMVPLPTVAFVDVDDTIEQLDRRDQIAK